MFYWICWVLMYLPIKIFFPTRVVGKKFMIKGKCIYTCNHTSNFDIIILCVNLHKKFNILAKKELFKNKFFGFILKKFGAISVDREHSDIEAIKQSLRALKNEKPLLIFPTGTRKDAITNADELKNGVGMLALKTSSPIVTMTLIKKPKIFRLNTLVINEKLDLSKYENNSASKEYYAEINNSIVENINNNIQTYAKKEM